MPSLNSKKGLRGINDEMEIYNNTEPILRNIGRFFEQWNGFPSGKGIIKGSFFSRFSVLAVGESDLKVRVDMNDTCHYTEENDDCTIKPKYSYGFVISRDFKTILDAFEISSKDEFLPLNAYDYPFVADNVRQLCEAVCQYVDPVSLILMESSFGGASKIKGLCNLDYDKGYTVKITIPCSHFRGKECKCLEQQ